MNNYDSMIAISTPELRGHIDAGVVSGAVIKSVNGCFVAIIERAGVATWILQTKRGEFRHFRTLDTAALYLRDLGIDTIAIDFSEQPSGRQMDMFTKRRMVQNKTAHAAAA